MDQFDRAQALELRQREEALARVRAPIADLDGVPGVQTALHCFECGDPIPEERRQAVKGTMYCVGCQEEYEKQLRMKP